MSVPVSIDGSPLYPPSVTDISIELEVADRPPITVATTAELNQEVGDLQTDPVELSVFPDPNGDKLAVLLNPVLPTNSDVPMVVLNRNGDVLAAVPQDIGPADNAQPAWSPNGQLLAYPTYTGAGPDLAIQSSSAQTATYPLASRNTQIGHCIWSPTATTVICPAQTGTRAAWEFTDLSNGHMDSIPSLGYPLAWMPSS